MLCLGLVSFTATTSAPPISIAALATSIPILPKPLIPMRTATASSIHRLLLLSLLLPNHTWRLTGVDTLVNHLTSHHRPDYLKALADPATFWSPVACNAPFVLTERASRFPSGRGSGGPDARNPRLQLGRRARRGGPRIRPRPADHTASRVCSAAPRRAPRRTPQAYRILPVG